MFKVNSGGIQQTPFSRQSQPTPRIYTAECAAKVLHLQLLPGLLFSPILGTPDVLQRLVALPLLADVPQSLARLANLNTGEVIRDSFRLRLVQGVTRDLPVELNG